LVLSQALSFLLPLGVWTAALKGRAAPDGKKIAESFRQNKNPGYINAVLIVALCLCLQPAMMLLSAVSALFFPNNVSDALQAMQGQTLLLPLAAVALTPAICEEAVFRGFILERHMPAGIKKAALVNGLFFGMIHLDLQQFAYAFFLGVVFAALVYHTRSIFAGVIAHFTINATQLLLGRLASFFSSSEEIAALLETDHVEYVNDLLSAVLYLFIAALIFMPAVVILFRALISHNKRRNTRSEMLRGMRAKAPDESGLIDPAAGLETDLSGETASKPPERPRVVDVYFVAAAVVYVIFMGLVY